MPHTLNTLAAFSAGEWSPTLDSRVDLPGYRKACRKLRNMIPMKQGGATRRPGLQYLGNGGQNRLGNKAVSRLEAFQYAPGTTFQLEFCDYGVRFWNDNGQVQVDPSVVVNWTLPSVSDGSFVISQYYKILVVGTTNWAAIGVTGTPAVGTLFTATGAGGSGTGSAGAVSAYPAGQFLKSSINSLTYYNTVAGEAPNDPSVDTTRFIQQTAYEVPSPYSATGTTSLSGTVTPFTAPNYWNCDIFQLQF